MRILMPGQSYQGPLPPPNAEIMACAERLRSDVLMLASEIGERNTKFPNALRLTESFITDRLSKIGYKPRKERYAADSIQVANIIAQREGSNKPDEIVVIGAHYDSAIGTPGANDNASSVAALLELALQLKDIRTDRTLRFVAFVNEEPPFTFTELMGSLVHASKARSRNEKIVAMICLECLGVYSDEPGSQQYPYELDQSYPETANFIAFCSNILSYPLLMECIKEFRASTPFPSEGLAAPENVTDVSLSDHWSFWQAGYPAIMVTDTAFFRYSHYHQPTDTPDKLDYERMARVLGGLGNVVRSLVLQKSSHY